MTTFAKGRVLADLTTPTDGDSIVAYLADTAGNFFTSTLVGGKRALDVNIVATSGQYAEDSAHVSGDMGSLSLVVRSDAGGSLTSADGDYSPLQVDATGRLRVAADLISSAEYAEDSPHTSGDIGNFMLAVRNDAGTALAADGDYSALQVDSLGRLRVASSSVANFEYAEDSAHTSGNIGAFTLGVRSDTEVALAGTNGDYTPFTTNAFGALRTTDKADSTVLQQLRAITTTATAIPATALANRKSIMVQADTGPIWIGSATVTSAGATSGIKLAQGDVFEADIGPGCALFGIAGTGTKNALVLEFA